MSPCIARSTVCLTAALPLESTARPIGEVLPLVLARYGAGPYRFQWCDERFASSQVQQAARQRRAEAE
jgi:hypothetical protein